VGFDPVTLEVIRSRFDIIAEEMQTALVRAAYSSVLKAGDASAAIFTAQGETIAQATSLPGLLGMLIPAVSSILRTFPPAEMHDGDIYILNDPYDGGTHIPDITLVTPVFHKGQVVGLCASIAHMQDMGGKVPGSIATDATEIYQEGLRIPPLKFYEEGHPNQTLHRLIEKNVRIPNVVMGDLRAQIAAGTVGHRRLSKLFDEYGQDTVLSYVGELLDRAEIMTRHKIQEIPDGSYSFTDYVDNDGIDLDRRIKIQATVTIQGSDISVDFAGTDSQVKGPINCVPSPVMAAVFYVVRAITDPSIPNNAGCYRPVQVHLPEGSVVNPNPPAAVTVRSVVMEATVAVLLGALVKAIPDRIPAASGGNALAMFMGGMDPLTGEPYVCAELGTGGFGARPTKDGIDVLHADVINGMNVPVESIEMDFPLRVHRHNLWTDSGGAGRHRGGLGYEKVFELLRGEISVAHRGEYHFHAPWGLFGGRPGRKSRSVILRQNGGAEVIPSKQVFTLKAGEQVHVCTAGGAGYGNPLERPAEAVLADVLDGKVSREAAKAEYGVIITGENPVVNEKATQRLRQEMGANYALYSQSL
jgi:N-methylhydantoinase B